MFNEVNYRDASFRTWNEPIYYGDNHVKEVWYRGHLFYPLGYIYNTTMRGKINAPLGFNFGSTRDLYFNAGGGQWQLFPFQATVNITTRTPMKPAGFAPFTSEVDIGQPFDFDAATLSGTNWMDNRGGTSYKGAAMGQDWAWNKIVMPNGNIEPILDSNGNITGFSGLSRKVQTNSILLGLESVQKHGDTVWDPQDATQGGWEFNVINSVEIMYNFSGDIAEAVGPATSYTSMGWMPGLSIDTLNHARIGDAYSNAFNNHSGERIKFGNSHRYYTDDGLIFEYWLTHDWYPVHNLSNFWYSGQGLWSGAYWRQNGVTGIQVRVYDAARMEYGIGGIYFVIPFDELVQANYHHYGEPDLQERAEMNWDEEKIEQIILSHASNKVLYLSPRSGQLTWQKSTIFEDDTYYAKEVRRASKAEMNQLTDNIYTKNSDKASQDAALRDMKLEYLESHAGSGGSTLYEERKKANKVYSVQFVSGNDRPLPKGQITFHIICDNAVDHKIVHSQTSGSTLNGRQVVQAPRKVYVTDAHTGRIDEIDALSVEGILVIDTLPDTVEIYGANRYIVNSFTLKTGSSSEIDSHTVKITVYPH